jgi:hypothetical protein
VLSILAKLVPIVAAVRSKTERHIIASTNVSHIGIFAVATTLVIELAEHVGSSGEEDVIIRNDGIFILCTPFNELDSSVHGLIECIGDEGVVGSCGKGVVSHLSMKI